MNDKQLEAIIYLHRCGTFKDAARAIYFESGQDDYVTPEALQYRIRSLESELGVSLYEKRQGTARVALTREGHLFLAEATSVHQRMGRWRQMFTEPTHGTLSLAATEPVILHRIPGALRQFHERFPRVRLIVRSAGPEEIERQVRQGKVDFGLGTHSPEGSDLDYEVWKRSSMVLVAPRDHALTRLEKVTLEDIARHPLVVLETEPGYGDDRALVDRAFRRAGIRYTENIVMETTNSEIIKCFVEAGLGVGIVAETTTLTMRYDLAVIDTSPLFGKTEVGILVREDRVITGPMRQLFLLFSESLGPWLERRAAQGQAA